MNRLGLIRKKSVQKSVKWVQNTVAAQRDDRYFVHFLTMYLQFTHPGHQPLPPVPLTKMLLTMIVLDHLLDDRGGHQLDGSGRRRSIGNGGRSRGHL